MAFSCVPSFALNLDGEYDILDGRGTPIATAVDSGWADVIVQALNDTEPAYSIAKVTP